ncbi:2-oxo-4-hydroxy-4-carboxy-5-ureidoimidazoline decarboxylase [Variovorax sp. RHLX14]|uniref:2-oxo-4-hydroxy-4-carboxy-5-ureidoimidazoline decarboxylase n=1 Tax=Variovorax sp. RHLX14 TaxID=1259731 RepID=UPI003F462903
MEPISHPITLASLNACSRADFLVALGGVFEHAPWVAEAVVDRRPFASVDAMHRAMLGVIRSLPEAERVDFLNVHPELAGAQARAGVMTADSTREQGALASSAMAAEEIAHWDRLNRDYRERFGFPFILCARRHSHASMLESFERRLVRERDVELEAAVQEIELISRLRLADRIADHGLPI